MTAKFLESANIQMAIVPVDLQTAANNGDWVGLVNYGRVVCLLVKAIGTNGDDPVFTMKQAVDNAGTSSKALTFTTVWEKVGTQTGIATFTKVTQTAAGSYTNTDSAEAQTLMAVEIRAEQLDVANGFAWVQLSIPDVGGNAQLGTAIYIMLDPKFHSDASAGMLSAIA